MCTEIEAKLKVDSHGEIEARLKSLGASFIETQYQADSYFDDHAGTLKNADKALRLRRQTTQTGQKAFITFKGPKQKHQLKKRREIQFEVADADAAEKMFIALGYKKMLVVEKKRALWRLGPCEVALDDLPELGTFVEIEGSDADAIAHAQKSLRLEHLAHIPKSYACLIRNKSSQKS